MKKLLTLSGLSFVFVLFLSLSTNAQRTISGTITDGSNNDPLIGANVLVAGTTQGTITDLDGSFSLNVPADAESLEISYAGFTTQRVPLGASNTLNVALSAGELLDEIVVTGYGTSKSREVTSSIVSVKAEDFNKGNVNDVSQLLQGKVGGLVISRPGANPNGDFNIRLRGLSTVGASTEPLVVIDGVLGGNLNSVEPQDIASIEVLKDGSASAIYGTRGASGVILVTTKKGEAGTSRVSYNGQVSFDVVDRVPNVLDAQEYVSFGAAQGTNLGGDIDWFDELTQTGLSHIHNLSLSGGTQQTTYRVSANFRDVQGIAKTTGFDRLNLRANLTQKALNDKLKITANIASSTEDASLGFDEAFRYATIFNPTTPFVRDESDPAFAQWDGYYQQVLFDYFNPVAIIEQNTRENTIKTLAASVRGEYSLTDDLSVAAFYSSQRSNTTFDQYFDKNSFFIGQNSTGQATKRNDEEQDQLFRLEANYNTELSNGIGLKLLGGYEYQDFEFSGFGATGGNFLTDAFRTDNLSAAQDFANGLGSVFSYRNTNRLISFFGRANVNVNDTYFITASLRRDGSSRFGEDNRWGLFPAVSAGVDLVKAAGISGFDQLKLRAGYGVTGNNVGQDQLSLQRFGPTGNFFFNGAFTSSFGPVSNANPDLKWETKTDINVGLDFALNDYKFTGSIEYYTSTTDDGIFLFNVPVPPNLFGQTWFNVGEINNDGIELSLNYVVNETYTASFTASRWFSPTLVSLTDDTRGVSLGGFQDGANLGSPGQNGTPLIRLEEGAPIGQILGLVINEDQPINEDGTWNFLDVDGDGTQDDISDRDIIGNGFPKWNLGFNNNFNFGNLDVNVFFRAVLGHDLVNTFRAFYEAPGQISAYNILDTSADIPNLVDQPQFSSRHVEKGDFLKLDNLTLGYTLGEGNLPSGFSKVRLFVTGQNLITITGYSGVSPEPRLSDDPNGDGSGFGSLAPGIDRRNEYFSARSFTFGANLGF
jgi:iron complex outermembrane receptor protein